MGGEGRDLSDLLLGRHRCRHLADLVADGGDGLLDAALEHHGVGARGDVPEAFADDGLRQHGRGGRSIASDVIGLGGSLLQKLRAHVLVVVFELNLLGDRHAVGADARWAELLVEDDIPSSRPEGYLHRVGQDVHPDLERPTGLVSEKNLFCHWGLSSRSSIGCRSSRSWPGCPAPTGSDIPHHRR